jgi:hypothetical protein
MLQRTPKASGSVFRIRFESDTMNAMRISSGTVHALPPDLKKALAASPKARAKWEDITPLARNEWICWTISVKTSETRKDHVKRVVSELIEGMRRPCCWIGCIHRKDKKVSKSVQWVLDRRAKAKK